MGSDWKMRRRFPVKRSWRSYSDRLGAIMSRLSRNKYLDAQTVKEISYKFAKKYSDRPLQTIDNAFFGSCLYVGMIDGQPPLFPWDRGYSDLVRSLSSMKKGELPELIILNVIVKSQYGGKNGKK